MIAQFYPHRETEFPAPVRSETEFRNEGQKICWYDPWPHPEIPALASTFPHHRHVPPDLRHHRVPAPGIRFEAPNLDVLSEDVRCSDIAFDNG